MRASRVSARNAGTSSALPAPRRKRGAECRARRLRPKKKSRRLGIAYDERITYVDLKKKIEAAQASKPGGGREGLD